MPLTLLDVIHYESDGWTWHTVETPLPDGPAVEAAIRRLDRNEWPFLWVHIAPAVEDEPPQNALCVMGGRGEYYLSLWKDGDYVCRYYDSTRGKTEVEIWESDQGATHPETWLCNDLDRVLAITRYFIDSGDLMPGTQWQTE